MQFHGNTITILTKALLTILFSSKIASGTNAEYALQRMLLKNNDPTSIPVKNASKPLMVYFDIALRSIHSLNAKSQTLDISAWIRISWQDEFMIWDPRNHSGVQSINVDRNKVWKPDVVLYNSADSTKRSLLFEKMTTNVIINHEGNVRWFTPVVLSSECSIELLHFPFDTQKCPLEFGLWTVPFSVVPRINLSIVNNYGDISSYQKNGIFKLNGMPGRSVLKYFPCCPGVPFVRLEYDIVLQRRTVFYFLDFFMPAFVLNVLLLFSYMLPPECGERMTLGISLMLAFVLHMLNVASHIPSTSDAVPMVTKFLSASTAFSAFSLIISAVATKWFLFKRSDSNDVSWFVRVVINEHLARFLLLGEAEEQQANHTNHSNHTNQQCSSLSADQPNHNSDMLDPDLIRPEFDEIESSGTMTRKPLCSDDGSSTQGSTQGGYYSIIENFRTIMGTLKSKELDKEYAGIWRRAVCVLDRLSCVVSIFFMLITIIYLMFIATDTYVK